MNYSVSERVQSGCDNFFDFYQVIIPGLIVNLYVKERTIDGTSWSSPQLLNYSVNGFIESMITTTVTADGKTHILYDAEQLIHRSYNCSTGVWSDEYEVTSYSSLTQSSSLTSASNDLYAVYREAAGGSSYLKYRQYDAIPLAPQSLSITAYQVGIYSHPKLNWSFNNEPDVYITSNAYEISRRTMPSGGSWSSWSVIDYVNGDQNGYVDYELNNVGADAYVAEYKIRAKDYTNHYSSYSSVASITFGRFAKQNEINTITEYKLEQNFPNPFNPRTTIDYSVESTGLVTLKVYDMLGTEVSSLVNENKEVCSYSVEFNASNFPSGIYFYTLTSGNFIDTKKLILLK